VNATLVAQRIGQPVEASHEMHERCVLKLGNVRIG
jgi:hypothetical protein